MRGFHIHNLPGSHLCHSREACPRPDRGTGIQKPVGFAMHTNSGYLAPSFTGGCLAPTLWWGSSLRTRSPSLSFPRQAGIQIFVRRLSCPQIPKRKRRAVFSPAIPPPNIVIEVVVAHLSFRAQSRNLASNGIFLLYCHDLVHFYPLLSIFDFFVLRSPPLRAKDECFLMPKVRL